MPGLMGCFYYCSIVSSLYITARHAMRSMPGTEMAQLLLVLLYLGGGGGGGPSSLHRRPVPPVSLTHEGSNR